MEIRIETRWGVCASTAPADGREVTIAVVHPSTFGSIVRIVCVRKRPEDNAGVSRVGSGIDLVCRDHEPSEMGSQHDRGSVDAVMHQKDTSDSTVDCVADRNDDYKGLRTGHGIQHVSPTRDFDSGVWASGGACPRHYRGGTDGDPSVIAPAGGFLRVVR
jgi:hypothetical protein